jgi:Amt family ammonium transporter
MFTFVGVKTEKYVIESRKTLGYCFIITAIVAMVSLFWPTKLPDASSGVFLEENNLVGADIAWLLASSGLVLLMTPGLSFFYGGMVGKKM